MPLGLQDWAMHTHGGRPNFRVRSSPGTSIQFHPCRPEANFLFDLIEQRYGNSSMLLCTQAFLGVAFTLGDAYADSIMHRLL